MRARALARLAIAGLVAVAPGCHRASGPPYSPEQERESFRLQEGFVVELVASEPAIASPVALDFDEDGRLFVVEMPGYPLDTSASGRGRK